MTRGISFAMNNVIRPRIASPLVRNSSGPGQYCSSRLRDVLSAILRFDEILSMKVLLYDKNHKLYFGRDGEWVRNATRARDFISGAAAAAYAVRHQLVSIEMVYTFADETQNVRVPIDRLSEFQS
jgi:hypothetical protein